MWSNNNAQDRGNAKYFDTAVSYYCCNGSKTHPEFSDEGIEMRAAFKNSQKASKKQ